MVFLYLITFSFVFVVVSHCFKLDEGALEMWTNPLHAPCQHVLHNVQFVNVITKLYYSSYLNAFSENQKSE